MSAPLEALRGRRVVGEGDMAGTIVQVQQIDARPYVRIETHDGQQVLVPYDVLVAQADGCYVLPIRSEELANAITGETHESIRIPVIAEELVVGRRTVERGKVRIHKLVETHEECVDEALLREDVDIERVPLHAIVQTPPEVRYEGETMIIPLMEEVLVVEKRLLVREEVRVTRRKTTFNQPQTVTLRREHVEVERIDSTSGTEPPATNDVQPSPVPHTPSD